MARKIALLAVVASVMALVHVGAAPVAAEPRGHHDRWDATFVDDMFCGSTTVTIRDQGHGMERQIGTTGEGFPLFGGHAQGTLTFTDADGDWVKSRYASAFKDLSVTVNPGGTITVVTVVTGKPEQLRAGDGTKLNMDVGRIVFARLIDHNGTIDPEDDEFLSSSVIRVSGPHPNAESDFELFCDLVLGYFAA